MWSQIRYITSMRLRNLNLCDFLTFRMCKMFADISHDMQIQT